MGVNRKSGSTRRSSSSRSVSSTGSSSSPVSPSSIPLRPEVITFIKREAKAFARKCRFPADDWKDIAQEIILDMIRRWDSVVARAKEKGLNPENLIGTLVRRAMSNLFKHRIALKRDYRNEVQLLDTEIQDEDEWVRLVDTFAATGPDACNAVDLADDVKAVIAALPKRDALICNLYLNKISVPEIAEILDRDPDTIYGLIRKLAKHPSVVILKKYLAQKSDRCAPFR